MATIAGCIRQGALFCCLRAPSVACGKAMSVSESEFY